MKRIIFMLILFACVLYADEIENEREKGFKSIHQIEYEHYDSIAENIEDSIVFEQEKVFCSEFLFKCIAAVILVSLILCFAIMKKGRRKR